MCRCLAVQPSGYYAWRKEPLSRRACEDARQTTLIRQAWNDSGRVYGYRKLHDDLLDQGSQFTSMDCLHTGSQSGTLDEPPRQLPRQCCSGKFFLIAQA
jgi:hypothetical protein